MLIIFVIMLIELTLIILNILYFYPYGLNNIILKSAFVKLERN